MICYLCNSESAKDQSPTHGGWSIVSLRISIPCFLSASVLSADPQGSAGRAATSVAHNSAPTLTSSELPIPELAREAIANGAELIADYGSFQIFRLMGNSPAYWPQIPMLKTSLSHNIIALHTARLNTATPNFRLCANRCSRSRQTPPPHPVAGPPKPEWRAELEKTGRVIITYISI